MTKMRERIQKIIANAGLCSRRKAEELILEGRVTVNGRVAGIGESAEYNQDDIRVNGKRILKPVKKYFALNKPKGYETTLKSESGKPTVISLLRQRIRIIPIGRLDVDSRGLLLLTNDGEFANRIMHPRYPIDKVYVVTIKGDVPIPKIKRLSEGIQLEDGMTHPCKIKILKKNKGITMLSMTLHEGRKRQIRRMIEAIDFNVADLIRTRIGTVTLRGLREGNCRELKRNEVKQLKKTVGMI